MRNFNELKKTDKDKYAKAFRKGMKKFILDNKSKIKNKHSKIK